MASRQEEPSEVDKGLVAFFSTTTKVWLGLAVLIIIVGVLT